MNRTSCSGGRVVANRLGLGLGLALCVGLGLTAPRLAAAAPHAHRHGVARLDVAVDADRITLALDSPLDNLVGFEHAPRTDAERARAAAAVANLRSAAALFRIDPAGGCSLASVVLDSGALKLGTPDPAEEEDGHADLDASFEFTCAAAPRAGFIDVSLFDAFAGMQRLDVQVAAPSGQFARSLARPQRRLSLVR